MPPKPDRRREHSHHAAHNCRVFVVRISALLNSWPVITNVRSTFDAEIKKAGWIFFFMAGKIEKTAFGSTSERRCAPR